jgi:hypothetical protein
MEVGVGVAVSVGAVGVSAVMVVVGVGVGGTAVAVGVAVGPPGAVPPPKSSSITLEALAIQSPMKPPLPAYVQALALREPTSAPFRYTSTVPSARARAPKRSPLTSESGMLAPLCTHPWAEEYVHTCAAWLPGVYITRIKPALEDELDCDFSSKLNDPAVGSVVATAR